MDTIVILRLGQENRCGEIPVMLRLSHGDDRPSVELTATLPSAVAVMQHYEQWQGCYQSLTSVYRRLDAPSQQISNVSSVEHCLALAQQLTIALNQWLNTHSFRPIKETLLQHLSVDEPVRVLLQAEDMRLQRLPWHLWDFIQNYCGAEVAISPASYQRPQQVISWRKEVAILAILGDSHGIDTEADRTLLSQLPEASVRFLVEPSRQDLSDELWERGWDILFFAGHSCTQDSIGKFAINATERLTINQLRYALRTAIATGLQLAIFNSCDGLGLAHQLVDLHIPQMIVMREPVPDQVAQAFLKYFLREFSQGQPLYQSVRTARERLQGLEGEFPCASWLPVIVQNPVAMPPSWQQLVQGNDRRQEPRSNTVTLVFTDLADSTAMKHAMTGHDLATRNQQFFQQVLKPHRQRVEANLSGYRGRVVKTEGDGHFLVFAHAASAVRWVTKLQLSYLHDPIFTPLGTVQIRVGIHTGSPLHDGADFVGQEVDQASRLEGLANAGQVLLSQATVDALQQDPQSNWQLHSHGLVDLKGIGQETVYELLWSDRPPQPLRQVGRLARPQLGLQASLAVGVAMTLAVMAMRWLGFLEAPELLAYDHLMQQRPVEAIDHRLLVVGITEDDVNRYKYPLSDQLLAEVLTTIAAHKPRAIGVDLHRSQPRGEGRSEFLRRFMENPNLFIVCAVNSPTNQFHAPPEFSVEQLTSQVGFSDIEPDWFDGREIVRRQFLVHDPKSLEKPNLNCVTPFSFSWQLAHHYLHPEGIAIHQHPQLRGTNPRQLGAITLQPLQPYFAAYQGWDWHGQQILLNYRAIAGKPSTANLAQFVTLHQVLSGQVGAELVDNRVVLVGVTVKYQDEFETPYGHMPGVYVHAHMVSQLLSATLDRRPLIWALPQWQWLQWGDTLWVLAWAIVGSILSWCFRPGWKLIATSGITVIALYYLCLNILIQGGWMPLVPSTLAFLLTIGTLLAYSVVYPYSRK